MASYTKICGHCGKKYETTTFWSRFCSLRCRVAAWRALQKKRKGVPAKTRAC